MSDDSVKVEFSGLVTVQNCLSQNNVETTQQELVSLFDDFDSDEISVNDYAQKITEKYGLESRDIVLDAISQIASNEGDNSVISKHDIELQRDKEFDTLLANMPELQESFQIILNNIVSNYGTSLQTTVENNGKIAHLWDSFKNATGMGASSDKAQAELDKAKSLLEELKNDPTKLKEIYKEITGNELNGEEFEKLSNNEADFKNSPIIKSVSKYIQGQKQTTNTISTIASAATVAGLIASGIFTGGLSWLAAGAICVGAGTASYMIPQVIDGTTEKDGYSKTEIAQDVLIGGFNSLVNTATLGSAKAIGDVITNKVANQAVARFLTAEVVANSLGDTIAVGDYALEAVATRLDDWTISEEDVALFEKLANGELKEGDEGYIEALQKYQEIYGNNSEFSLKGLAITGGTAVVASTAAGAAGYEANVNTGSLISRLTQNSPRALQNGAKILSGGLTGYAAGGSAAFAGGATSYLLNTDFSDINAQDLLDASTENLATGTLTGAASGIAFETINVAAGIHASQGAKKFDINKLDFDYKNPDEVVSALRSGKITQSDLVEIFKSMPEIEVKALHRSLTKITHPDTCGPNNESYIINDAYTNYQDFLKTNTPIAQSETQANAQTAPKPPQTTAQQNENENPKAIVAQNQTLALNSENPKIESVVGFNSGMLSGMMAPVNAPLNSQNANENSGSTLGNLPIENNNPVQFDTGKEEALEATQTPQKPQKIKIDIPKGSELDLQIKSLTKETVEFLSSNAHAQGIMDEALEILGISRGEITTDNNGIHHTATPFGDFSSRIKSEESSRSKVIKKVSNGTEPAPQTMQDIFKMVKDIQGVRLTLNSLDKNISDSPLTKAELEALQTEQNKPFVDALVKAMLDDKMHIFEIENYSSEDGIPYLTETDEKIINNAYKTWFREKLTKVLNKECDDFTCKQDEKGIWHLYEKGTNEDFSEAMVICKHKSKDNGYTGANISYVNSDGEYVEFQLRGSGVNGIAQPEHVIYDCRQGKETVAGEEYREVREVVSKIYAIKDKNAKGYDKYENPKLAQAYDRYFADIYNAGREIELGKRENGNYPDINEYEVLVNELTPDELKTVSFEGVKKLCDEIEVKYLKEKITEKAKELNCSEIIDYVETYYQAQLADKILSDERLFTNPDFMKEAGNIVRVAKTPEQAQAKCDLIDKILSDERLYGNSEFMKMAGGIICYADTPEQAQLANKILSDERLYGNSEFMKTAGYIIDSANTPEQAQIKCELIDKILSNERLYGNSEFIKMAERVIYNTDTPEKAQVADKILSNEAFIKLIQRSKFNSLTLEAYSKLTDSDISKIDELDQAVELQRVKALEHPELYVNGEFENKDDAIKAVNDFFDENKAYMIVLSSVLDKEAMNNLLRMRFDDAKNYLRTIRKFDTQDIQILKDMASSCNIDGKPIMPTQKIEFIDLLDAYKANNLDTSKMLDMIAQGRIDTAQLNVDLFNGILRNCGLTEDEISQTPIEKLTAWDTRYAHLLSKEIKEADDSALVDLLRAENLDDFTRYIQDESNIYGQTNARTKAMFEDYGMDYDAWLKPSKENEVQFQAKDKNLEKLDQIATQITEDIESLRQTAARGFIDKQFAKYLKDGQFVIPTEYTTSRAKLEEFTNNVLKQLESVFKRAEGNINNPSKAASAQNTLTIKDHLNQRLADISAVTESKSTKTLDLTIKMWDRVPQKDIFQGNYSTCCIGMGGGNGSAMPHYLLDTAYNMIELVDNKTGKTVGNALCYFITDSDGKPAFIIDNIEIKNADKPSDDVGIELRDAMVQYAYNVACVVTGTDDTKIYMSSQYNDVPWSDLKTTEAQISFLGDTDCDEIYMDLYGGWVDKDKYTALKELLILKDRAQN